jgi:transcription antitermination factor NusG
MQTQHQLDSRPNHAPCPALLARGPPFSVPASGVSNTQIAAITSKFGHGGARENSGGLRSPAGGRPRKPVHLMPEPIDRWYCVRTAFNQERDADTAVRLDGFEVFNPSIFAKAIPPRRGTDGVMRPGKPDRVEPLLKRYFFVRLNLSDPYWYQIKRLPGVDCVMSGADLDSGGSAHPIAIPDRAIEWLRAMLVNDCFYPDKFRDAAIKVGTALRMLDGVLADRTGICDESDGLEVKMSLFLMGHIVKVTVPQSSVEPV